MVPETTTGGVPMNAVEGAHASHDPDVPSAATLILPPAGTVLPAGDHLVEIELSGALEVDPSNGDRSPSDVLVRVLTRFGFRRLRLDRDVIVTSDPAWPVRYRFVGRLEAPITLRAASASVRWAYVHPMQLDPFADAEVNLLETMSDAKVRPTFRRDARYALHFLAWKRNADTHADVSELLTTMGFNVERLFLLKDGIKYKGASMARWYAVAAWARPDSLLSSDDPFWFEEVVRIA